LRIARGTVAEAGLQSRSFPEICRVPDHDRAWKLESMGNLQGDSTKDFEEILSAIQKEECMKVAPI